MCGFMFRFGTILNQSTIYLYIFRFDCIFVSKQLISGETLQNVNMEHQFSCFGKRVMFTLEMLQHNIVAIQLLSMKLLLTFTAFGSECNLVE